MTRSWRVYAKVSGAPTPMGDTKAGPVACSEYLWASPGVDRVHEHNLAVIRDIVTRYAVDGIHLDRVRYPGRQYSHDPETYKSWHAAAPPVSLENWQRDHLSQWIGRYRAGDQGDPAGGHVQRGGLVHLQKDCGHEVRYVTGLL